MTYKFIFAILFFTFLGHQTSFACDCLETKSVKESIKLSDIVISAKIISQEIWYFNNDLDTGLYVKFRGQGRFVEAQIRLKAVVTAKFKGQFKTDTLIIVTSYGEESCGYEFEVGKSYIIYGHSTVTLGYEKKGKLANTFETTLCTRTRLLDQNEVAEIKKHIGH